MTRKQVGNRIRRARQARGLTHLDLTFKVRDLGILDITVDPSKLSRIENGQSPVSVTLLAAIAQAMDMDATELDPDAEPDLSKMRELLLRSRWFSKAS